MYPIYTHDMPYFQKANETSNDYEYAKDKSVCNKDTGRWLTHAACEVVELMNMLLLILECIH